MATAGYQGFLSVSTASNGTFSKLGQNESSLSMNREIIEVPRASQAYTAKIVERLNWSTSGEVYLETSDAAYVVLKNAFFNGTPIFIQFDPTTGGSDQITGSGLVESFEMTAAGGAAAMVSYSIVGNSLPVSQ